MSDITVAEIIETLTELVNERQPLGIHRQTYQRALDVLARIDALGAEALASASYVITADYWQLVPAVPTRAMTDAFWNRADCPPNHWTFVDSYRAMLAAAPPAPGQNMNEQQGAAA